MKLNRIILAIAGSIFCGLLLVPAFALSNQIRVQAGISIYPDPRSAPLIYVEFPFAVNRHEFSFLREDSSGESMVAGIYAELILSDSLGNTVDSASTYFLTRATDSTDAADEKVRLFNRLSLMVQPGLYSAQLTVLDAVGKTEGTFKYNRLEIDPVEEGKLSLSSLEFAHDIQIVDTNSEDSQQRLVKNGRQVIPSPMGIFSENDSSLFVYAELYNLEFHEGNNDTFLLNYLVYNENGSLYADFGEMNQIKPGSSSVISNVLNIDGYIPGRYILKLIAKDYANNQIDTATSSFIIFPKSGDLPHVVSYSVTHPYDTASLKTKLQLTKYIIDPQQLRMLETLNDVGKARYIDQFFADMDPDHSTDENEYLDDVIRRYNYANEFYSSLPLLHDGWTRDRGRVLLQYGHCDRHIEDLAPAYGKPWEKWTYHSVQGGVIFVFQDFKGFGDYELVHSTANGEIFDSEWDKFIRDNEPVFLD